MRLVQPPGRIAGGRIVFNGRDLLTLDEKAMRSVRGADIALIFQEPMTALNPVFRVGDQIAETLLVHGRATRREAKAKAIELLRAVRIPDPASRVNDYPHQLSGGMRQRVLIAMALACQPSLVIADEPTTALDVTIQAEILDLLREMKTALNLSLLLITHDLGVIAETADRVAVMYAGRIVEIGAGARDLPQPRAIPTRAGCSRRCPADSPGQRLRAIDGSVPLLGSLPPGCAFNPRCPDRFEPCTAAPPPDYPAGPEQTAKCYLHDPRYAIEPKSANPQSAIRNPQSVMPPLVEVSHLVKQFTRDAGLCSARARRSPRSTMSASASTKGRRSGWSANRAAARRRPAAACCGWSNRPRAKCDSAATTCWSSRGGGCARRGATCRSCFRIRTRRSTRACGRARSSRSRWSSTSWAREPSGRNASPSCSGSSA